MDGHSCGSTWPFNGLFPFKWCRARFLAVVAKWPTETPFIHARPYLPIWRQNLFRYFSDRHNMFNTFRSVEMLRRWIRVYRERRNEIEVFLLIAAYIVFVFSICYAERYSGGCNVGEIQLVLHCWTRGPRILWYWHVFFVAWNWWNSYDWADCERYFLLFIINFGGRGQKLDDEEEYWEWNMRWSLFRWTDVFLITFWGLIGKVIN